MLQSTATTLLKSNQENQNSLNKLQMKMYQNSNTLESIQQLLNINTHSKQLEYNQQHTIELEEECKRVKLELFDRNQTLREKMKLLEKAQHEVEALTESLELLSIKYDSDIHTCNEKYFHTKKELAELEKDYEQLSKKHHNFNDMINQLEEENENEMQRKDLLLRESTQEQKILTQGVLERDQKIEEYEQNIKDLEQILDEKNEELNSFLKKVSIEEEYEKLQEKVVRLEEENVRFKKRLENLNELYHHKEQHEEDEDVSISNHLLSDDIDDEEEEREWIQSSDHIKPNNNKSRIPVLSTTTTNTHIKDTTNGSYQLEEINMMKEDLLLYQDKLVEKISQNRELENAMERVNEHCLILRKSLNETREESADRYRKMMQYMEENRVLREKLHRLS